MHLGSFLISFELDKTSIFGWNSFKLFKTDGKCRFTNETTSIKVRFICFCVNSNKQIQWDKHILFDDLSNVGMAIIFKYFMTWHSQLGERSEEYIRFKV